MCAVHVDLQWIVAFFRELGCSLKGGARGPFCLEPLCVQYTHVSHSDYRYHLLLLLSFLGFGRRYASSGRARQSRGALPPV